MDEIPLASLNYSLTLKDYKLNDLEMSFSYIFLSYFRAKSLDLFPLF